MCPPCPLPRAPLPHVATPTLSPCVSASWVWLHAWPCALCTHRCACAPNMCVHVPCAYLVAYPLAWLCAPRFGWQCSPLPETVSSMGCVCRVWCSFDTPLPRMMPPLTISPVGRDACCCPVGQAQMGIAEPEPYAALLQIPLQCVWDAHLHKNAILLLNPRHCGPTTAVLWGSDSHVPRQRSAATGSSVIQPMCVYSSAQ